MHARPSVGGSVHAPPVVVPVVLPQLPERQVKSVHVISVVPARLHTSAVFGTQDGGPHERIPHIMPSVGREHASPDVIVVSRHAPPVHAQSFVVTVRTALSSQNPV